MAKWYKKADAATHNIVKQVMKQHHKRLHEAGVKVDVVLVDSDGDHALKVRGVNALACVCVLSLKDRAMGRGDAEITIDASSMKAWSDRRLQAIIDHELTHLVVKEDKKTGKPARDDLDRPKLGMRGHDYEFGWFEDTVERFGNDSAEVMQARKLLATATWMQPLLPGLSNEAA